MRNWIRISAWILFSIGVIVVLYFANAEQGDVVLEKPDILIHVEGENAFLTEDELFSRLKYRGFIQPGQKHSKVDIAAIENYIRKMSEVKDVRVFSGIGNTWTIDINVRKPIARIYNKFGESYYLDEEGMIVSVSPVHTARVVVVTGYIPDRIKSGGVPEIINNDSLITIRKLDDVYRISNYVCNDPLMQSLIGQVHLKKNNDFVLIPLVGDQKIIFGTARTDEEVKEKFEKLKIFYEEAIPYEGWDKYEEINLKYGDQIVGKKRKDYKEEIEN